MENGQEKWRDEKKNHIAESYYSYDLGANVSSLWKSGIPSVHLSIGKGRLEWRREGLAKFMAKLYHPYYLGTNVISPDHTLTQVRQTHTNV